MTGPEWMPCTVAISDASWDQLRGELEEVVARHPILFPDFKKGQRDYENYEFTPAHRANERFMGAWGRVWGTTVNGLEGQVVQNPLNSWDKWKDYKVPDPLVQADRGPADWEGTRRRVEKEKSAGRPTFGGVPHGFLFMRLYYLRGFENLMLDFATEETRSHDLLDMLVDHNRKIVDQWLSMDVDVVTFGDDLGTQHASVISPRMFHKWITPAYKTLMKPCREAGCHVYLHSDGYIVDLIEEFIECGVTIINPQDLCNGIENLAREVKGRICIRLDIDQQHTIPYGTRREIWELVEGAVRKLGSPKGGLGMSGEIYPPTLPENVDALCEALEAFRNYWWDGRGKNS